MNVQQFTVPITTDASGDAVAYSPVFTGRVNAIHYVKAGSGGFADTVDFAIVSERTGQNIWTEANVTASKTVAPSQPLHTQAGVVIEDQYGYIDLWQDRIKITIDEGGNATTGTFIIVVE